MTNWLVGKVATLKILLDSHTFVWFTSGSPLLSKRASAAIISAPESIFVSAATSWEIATKVRIGKWPEAVAFVTRMNAILVNFRFTPLPVSIDHGLRAGSFRVAHKDPFDRMLAAQSELENLVLITADPAFASFGTQTLW